MTFEKWTLLVAGLAAASAFALGVRRGFIMRTIRREDSEDLRLDKRYREVQESRRSVTCSWVGVAALILTPNSVFGSFLIQAATVVIYALVVWIGSGVIARYVWGSRRPDGKMLIASADAHAARKQAKWTASKRPFRQNSSY
jgi:hypothetical protein